MVRTGCWIACDGNIHNLEPRGGSGGGIIYLDVWFIVWCAGEWIETLCTRTHTKMTRIPVSLQEGYCKQSRKNKVRFCLLWSDLNCFTIKVCWIYECLWIYRSTTAVVWKCECLSNQRNMVISTDSCGEWNMLQFIWLSKRMSY